LPGKAFVQTLFPEHDSIQLACRQDYRAFYEGEIRYRRAMRYPPAVALINAIVRGRTFARAMADASDLAVRLKALPAARGYRVLGPAPAALGKLRGEYRVQLLVKGSNRPVMRAAVLEAIHAVPDLHRRVTVDVDPFSMM
jgi:primosomal protein N' (replication factor Y)